MLNRSVIAAFVLLGHLAAALGAAAPTPSEPVRNYLIHPWQTDNGLPQNWVSSIAQTRDGYLWIGTRYGGLARFDGIRFVSFNQQDTPELKDVQVEHLSVDETGRLWIIMGNESVTSFQNGRFELWRLPRAAPRLRADHALFVRSNHVLFAGELGQLPRLDLSRGTNGWERLEPAAGIDPEPSTFVADHNDVVWSITRNQRLLYFRNDRFEIVDSARRLPETAVTATAVDSSRRLWVATPHHVLMLDGENFVDRTPANGVPPEDILQLAFSGDGGLWVLEKNRLRKLVGGNWVTETRPGEFQPDTAPGTFTLRGDATGNAWLISNGHGLWHVKSDGSATLLTEKSGLPSVFITCWFQDAEGDVWIGTAGGGIARIRESLFHTLGQAQGLPGKVVRSVCVDNLGALWAGTMSGGLARLQEDRFISVNLPNPESNPNESVTVCPDPEGGLWVGTLNHGLMRLFGGKFFRPATPWGSVRVLFGDSRGELWVGGLVGLFSLNSRGATPYSSAQGFVDAHAIGAIAEDAEGSIWLGTGPGDLWRFMDGRFTSYAPPVQWPAVRFSAVLPDTNHIIWIGTLGGGLLRFRNGQFARYTKLNGLPSDNVSQLLDSGDGHLWGGTYAGIFRVSKTDLEEVAIGRATRLPCRVYGMYDGLPSLECSSGFQPSCWHGTNGHLYFSTANGIVTVNPLELSPSAPAPRSIIEEMLVDGKPRDLVASDGPGAPELKLDQGRHYVQFRFTGPNFSAPDGVRFRIKLEGVDADWQNAEGQRFVGYGPLLPGPYKFNVLACNNEGIWNQEGDTLAFVVPPYFWETWLFKIVLGLFTLILLGVVVALAQRRRYRLKLERVEHQREMERERTRIARDLHDDLGTSLTQISMLSSLANREGTPAAEARELIQQVRGRAREMVTALDEIVWAVNPKNDSLAGLVGYLGHFAEEFYRPTEIRCRLDIPSDLASRPLSADVRHHLFLAFKEALNNTARHSGAQQVTVRIKTDADELIIEIEDDGHGLEKQAQLNPAHGNGLINMKRRMEQLGGRAEWRGASGKGTTVIFRVPLK